MNFSVPSWEQNTTTEYTTKMAQLQTPFTQFSLVTWSQAYHYYNCYIDTARLTTASKICTWEEVHRKCQLLSRRKFNEHRRVPSWWRCNGKFSFDASFYYRRSHKPFFARYQEDISGFIKDLVSLSVRMEGKLAQALGGLYKIQWYGMGVSHCSTD